MTSHLKFKKRSRRYYNFLFPTLLALLISSCSNPLGDKSVANPSTGDSSGGGGNTNPASCTAASFTPQIRIALSTQIDSNTLTMSGCTEPVLISVAGDGNRQLYKNGTLVSGTTNINNADTLFVRLTSSSLQSTTYQATVNIGSRSTVFAATTGNFTPAAFTFTPATGQALSTTITSNQATLSGFDGVLNAHVTGSGSPVILVNGTVVGTSTTVTSGNAISIRLMSANTVSTTRQATVTIGGVTAQFDVTTTGDATLPSITSLTAPANGNYGQSANLDFTANFTKPVTVTGTPRIILNIGGVTKYANYLSGSGMAALLFRYTIEAGMNDTNGIGVSSIQLNGGTINDLSGIVADLSFMSPDTAAVLVDSSAPTVQTATGPASGTYAPGQYLNFNLTFNKPINVTGTPRLALTIGSVTRYANYLSGTGTNTILFRYTIQTGDSDSDGIVVAPSIDLNGGTLSDVSANPAILTFTAPNTASVNIANCPVGYVPVAPLPPYTTSFFCVAKYEMKNVSGAAASQAAGVPWASITRDSSAAACSSLGIGYTLISNAQWQTVARNLENVAFNWSSATVGNAGGMNQGHYSNSPSGALAASTDDNDSCVGLGTSCDLSTWNDQRRVYQLDNGSYIWDFSGNLWEWVLDNSTTDFGSNAYVSTITTIDHPVVGSIGGVSDNAKYHFGPAGDYTALWSAPYGGLGMAWLNYSTGAIIRGGGRGNGVGSGIFATYLAYGPLGGDAYVGFRCVWSP